VQYKGDFAVKNYKHELKLVEAMYIINCRLCFLDMVWTCTICSAADIHILLTAPHILNIWRHVEVIWLNISQQTEATAATRMLCQWTFIDSILWRRYLFTAAHTEWIIFEPQTYTELLHSGHG